jgi:hypothetical protein
MAAADAASASANANAASSRSTRAAHAAAASGDTPPGTIERSRPLRQAALRCSHEPASEAEGGAHRATLGTKRKAEGPAGADAAPAGGADAGAARPAQRVKLGFSDEVDADELVAAGKPLFRCRCVGVLTDGGNCGVFLYDAHQAALTLSRSVFADATRTFQYLGSYEELRSALCAGGCTAITLADVAALLVDEIVEREVEVKPGVVARAPFFRDFRVPMKWLTPQGQPSETMRAALAQYFLRFLPWS